jgi:hypothetical protein
VMPQNAQWNLPSSVVMAEEASRPGPCSTRAGSHPSRLSPVVGWLGRNRGALIAYGAVATFAVLGLLVVLFGHQ